MTAWRPSSVFQRTALGYFDIANNVTLPPCTFDIVWESEHRTTSHDWVKSSLPNIVTSIMQSYVTKIVDDYISSDIDNVQRSLAESINFDAAEIRDRLGDSQKKLNEFIASNHSKFTTLNQ